jgi:hypothetical protein
VGGFCLVIREKVFEAMQSISGWDWRYCEAASRLGLPILCTRISYAEHIGDWGVNSRPGELDKALHFANA